MPSCWLPRELNFNMMHTALARHSTGFCRAHWRAHPNRAVHTRGTRRGPHRTRAVETDQKSQYAFDISPYLVWEKTTHLTASWDARCSSQESLHYLEQHLKDHAALNTQMVQAQQVGGGTRVTLTATCRAADLEQLAAAVLQMTPATEVASSPGERCYLPQQEVPVNTTWGPVQVLVCVAGSSVYKAQPCWHSCGTVAAGAGDAAVTAEVVAQVALNELRQGLEEGRIDLGMDYM